MTATPAQHIEDLIEPTLTDMGYEIVRVSLGGPRGALSLQIMAERADRTEITVDDCAGISRAVSALLDVEDPIGGAYTLEVSSPGIDRPLTRAEHFERFAGQSIALETVTPIEGRRRFKGQLTGLDGAGAVRLELDESTESETVILSVALDNIAKSKLHLTDALLAAGRKPGRRPPTSTA